MTGPKLGQMKGCGGAPDHGGMAQFYEQMTQQFLDACTSCRKCLEECPLFPSTPLAPKGPVSAWGSLMRLLESGEDSPDVREMLVSCSWGCNTCTKACPADLVPRMAHMLAMAKLVSAGKDPGLIQPTAKNRYSMPNVLQAIQMTPAETRWIKKAPPNPDPVDVVFWASCSGTNHPNVLLDTIAVLERLGMSFVTLGGGEICCGLSAIMRGDLDDIERLGREWVDNIAAFRPKKVVFLCQGCQARCSGVMPGLPSPLPFEYAWLPEFLVENLDKIRFDHPVNKVVAIHDSCGVTSLGTYDCTRELLRAIPGLKLVEMEHNRENTLCCGGVAAYHRPQPTTTMRHGALREAKAAGADVLATTCIGCNMVYLPLEDQYGLKVQNFMTLAAEGVGVHNEDRLRNYLHYDDAAKLLADTRRYAEASNYTPEEIERIVPSTFGFLKTMSQ